MATSKEENGNTAGPQIPLKGPAVQACAADTLYRQYVLALKASTAAQGLPDSVLALVPSTVSAELPNSVLTLVADGVLESLHDNQPSDAETATRHRTGSGSYPVPEPKEGPLAVLLELLAFYHRRGEPTGLTRLSKGLWQIQPRGYRV